MQIYGNIQALKKGIEEKYAKEIRDIDKDITSQIREINKETDKKVNLMKADQKTVREEEVRKTKSRVMNEEKLKAKKAFEEAREKMIDSVFKDAEKKLGKKANEKAYIDLVKKKIPKDAQAIVGDAVLKKHFSNAKMDKTVIGVKFKSENIIYDFSLNGLLESRKEHLRSVITKSLWGG
jgi:vacuolar-type H+-ATPase subunit E/Vma4